MQPYFAAIDLKMFHDTYFCKFITHKNTIDRAWKSIQQLLFSKYSPIYLIVPTIKFIAWFISNFSGIFRIFLSDIEDLRRSHNETKNKYIGFLSLEASLGDNASAKIRCFCSTYYLSFQQNIHFISWLIESEVYIQYINILYVISNPRFDTVSSFIDNNY